MAKIFLGIAIAVMIATAALGFIARGNIDKLQSTLKQKQDSLTRAEGSLRTAQSAQKAAEEKQKTAEDAIEGVRKDVAAKQSELDATNAKISQATAEIAEKDKRIAELEKAKGSPGPDNVPPPSSEELTRLQAQVASLERDKAELVQVQETLRAQTKEAEDRLAGTKRQVDEYKQGYQRQGLSGRILAVNPGWNFVVLSIGDRQGAKVGSTMLVMRGSDAIAKARITAVEPSSSIADVLPGSVRKGVTVQPGDTVIYQGNR
jgi:hypothetical protein